MHRLLCTLFVVGLLTPLGAAAQEGGPYGDYRVRRTDHLNYLSSSCRSLYDLAVQRPNSATTPYALQRMRDAQEAFQEKCQEELFEAHERVQKDQYDKRNQRTETEKTLREADAQRARDQSTLRAQCIESRRIIAKKYERTDLSAGEKQDLARFEENVRARCPLSAAASAAANASAAK